MYYCFEPPKESEDPLCQYMCPEYSSGEAAGGPHFSEEYMNPKTSIKSQRL